MRKRHQRRSIKKPSILYAGSALNKCRTAAGLPAEGYPGIKSVCYFGMDFCSCFFYFYDLTVWSGIF